MRAFIGLDLSPQAKVALEQWRQTALPDVSPKPVLAGKSKKTVPNPKAQPVAVPAANYHITLCFLGHIEPRQHEQLVSELESVNHAPFSLTLNSSGLWQGPKILFAAPGSVPDELTALARSCRKAARNAEIETDAREYRPHVTLVRKAGPTLPPPLFLPDIETEFTQFHLFESVSAPSGVHYPIRQSWNLTPALSIREKLRRGFTPS